MKLPPFPKGVRLNIEVVFPGEYRIGYEYQGVTLCPGVPKYYPFHIAIWRCWGHFYHRFYCPKEKQQYVTTVIRNGYSEVT